MRKQKVVASGGHIFEQVPVSTLLPALLRITGGHVGNTLVQILIIPHTWLMQGDRVKE